MKDTEMRKKAFETQMNIFKSSIESFDILRSETEKASMELKSSSASLLDVIDKTNKKNDQIEETISALNPALNILLNELDTLTQRVNEQSIIINSKFKLT